MLESMSGLQVLAWLMGVVFVAAVLISIYVQYPVRLTIFMSRPQLVVDKVRRLLEEIRFELTVPSEHLGLTDKPLSPDVDRLNYIATRLRKYVERNVLEYIDACSYVDKMIWLRKPRVITDVIDDCIRISVRGIGNVNYHTILFMPSEYAHAVVYFKNEVCRKEALSDVHS